MENDNHVSASTFVMVWVALMALTVSIIALSFAHFGGKELLMLLCMFAMAYLVVFYFMHLRFERFPLVLSVVLGVLLTTALLYALIIWDGTRIVRVKTLG